MPRKNIVRVFEEECFYHVCNRGVDGAKIFLDTQDYQHFEWLLERTLTPKPGTDAKGRDYTWLRNDVELNAYSLSPRHFHLLCYQYELEGITKLMRTISTAYTMYFNRKYGRQGPLFEASYRAVPVFGDWQVQNLSRYIHMNPFNFWQWPFTSLHDYLNRPRPWLDPKRIKAMFKNTNEYREFMRNRKQAREDLEAIKPELAHVY
jgi:putative transposase